jgi:hypothetical protein
LEPIPNRPKGFDVPPQIQPQEHRILRDRFADAPPHTIGADEDRAAY